MTLHCLHPAPAPQRARRAYVASSWRTEHHAAVVEALRGAGWIVHDYRAGRAEPVDALDLVAGEVTIEGWDRLVTPEVQAAHVANLAAIDQADVCVLVLPSGASALHEVGVAVARQVPVVALALGPFRPEIALCTAPIVGSIEVLLATVDLLTLETLPLRSSR